MLAQRGEGLDFSHGCHLKEGQLPAHDAPGDWVIVLAEVELVPGWGLCLAVALDHSGGLCGGV